MGPNKNENQDELYKSSDIKKTKSGEKTDYFVKIKDTPELRRARYEKKSKRSLTILKNLLIANQRTIIFGSAIVLGLVALALVLAFSIKSSSPATPVETTPEDVAKEATWGDHLDEVYEKVEALRTSTSSEDPLADAKKYLLEEIDAVEEPEKKFDLNMLLGNAYAKNGDYDSALNLYLEFEARDDLSYEQRYEIVYRLHRLYSELNDAEKTAEYREKLNVYEGEPEPAASEPGGSTNE